MTVYLDASVLLPSLLPEPASAAVDIFLDGLPSAPMVSDFAAAEVASAISRLVRMGSLTESIANRRLADFDAWRAKGADTIEVVGADVRLCGVIVRRFHLGLRSPDALHVAICRRLSATLVTLDSRLAAACESFGVLVTQPSCGHDIELGSTPTASARDILVRDVAHRAAKGAPVWR